MAEDVHGVPINGFKGPSTEVAVYGQQVAIPGDFAQWLANMGHTVTERGNNGEKRIIFAIDPVVIPLVPRTDDPEMVRYMEYLKQKEEVDMANYRARRQKQ